MREQKKNIKTELQGTYFYTRTPSSSLANVYCEVSKAQHKFAGKKKIKNTYGLELLGLQRFLPKHLHQYHVKRDIGNTNIPSLVNEG
jgi:predicted nuclease of restriction endonuclease-like (RecB) superfamily